MKIRFQGDANFHGGIISGLRKAESSIDFRTSDEAGLRGVSDPQVLLAASSDERILVTHDRRTMRRYFAELIQKQDCPGVFVIGQNLPIKKAIDELLLIWHTSEAEEWANPIIEIPL